MTAKRDEVKPPYNLIPRIALEALARRFEKGLHYGRDNWKKGDQDWLEDAFNHALEHLYKYNEADVSEDTQIQNLAAVMWFCTVAIWHLSKPGDNSLDRNSHSAKLKERWEVYEIKTNNSLKTAWRACRTDERSDCGLI